MVVWFRGLTNSRPLTYQLLAKYALEVSIHMPIYENFPHGFVFFGKSHPKFQNTMLNVNCRLIGGHQESPSLIGVYVSSDHNLTVYIKFFTSGWIFFRDIRSYLCDHLMAVKAEAMVIHPFCIQNRCFTSCALFTEDCMAVVTKYIQLYYD